MGGHNAMSFAAWYPDRLSGLVIADSRPAVSAERLREMHRRGRRPLRVHESAELAIGRFRLLPPETTAPAAFLEHLARMGIGERDGKWVYGFDPASDGTRVPADAWPLLPRIACPTLILRGERSTVLTRETAQAILERIRGARLAEVPDAYHHFMLDQPAAFSRILERFFSSLAPR